MRKLTEYLILTAGFLALNCKSQPLPDQLNFRSGEMAGLQLYGVSVFSGYSTSAYPVGQSIQPGAPSVGGDSIYGASASMGFQRHRDRMNFSVIYSPSYSGQVNYSNLNSLNHTLLINGSRKLSQKWTVSLSGSGQDISLTQFLFNPPSIAVQSLVPATFDDLAATFAAGQFTNSQVASMLTGASPLESPTQNLLYGYKTLSYSAQASVVYAYSSRLSFHFGSFAAGSQPLNNGSQVPQTNLVNHTIGANGGVSMVYSLTPRTQLGVNVEESRQINRYQSAYITTTSASISRKMGMHWFVNLKGGWANTRETKLGGAPPSNQAIGGGALGFKTYRHTLTASYNRTSTDSYGLVGTNSDIGGSWIWHQPGNDWTLTESFSEQQTRNTGFVSLSGWEASSGVTRKLSNRSMLTAQYVYLTGRSTFGGVTTNLSVHSVRLSMGWSPQPIVR